MRKASRSDSADLSPSSPGNVDLLRRRLSFSQLHRTPKMHRLQAVCVPHCGWRNTPIPSTDSKRKNQLNLNGGCSTAIRLLLQHTASIAQFSFPSLLASRKLLACGASPVHWTYSGTTAEYISSSACEELGSNSSSSSFGELEEPKIRRIRYR